MKSEFQRTLVILKPDAVCRGLMGKIITRFEEKGLNIESMKMEVLKKRKVEEHYSHIKDLENYPIIIERMVSGPSVVMIVSGENAVDTVLRMRGTTFDAMVGTIRGDYCTNSVCGENLIHCSDSLGSANIEIMRFVW